eukprot:gene867-1689_t
MQIRLLYLLLVLKYVIPYSYNNLGKSISKNQCKISIQWAQSISLDSYSNKTYVYSSEDVLLKKTSDSFSVKLPPGIDSSFSEKDLKLISKKENLQANQSTMSDLDILKEELRIMIEKMAE